MILALFRARRLTRRIAELERELDDERATIVSIECAVKPACRDTIKRLEQEVDHLKSQIEAPPSGS